MSNINENRINFTFTAADITAMNTAVNTILTKMPANSSLSEDQRLSYNAIDVDNKVYCDECLSEALATGTGIISTYISLPNLTNDLTVFEQMKNLQGAVNNLSQRISDVIRIAGHESFKVSNQIYKNYKDAAENGVDNATAGYERLKQRYDAQGNAGRRADTEA
jgi:hypothetical protein